MIELHRADHRSFDNGGEVLINTAEIAYIARSYKPGTDFPIGTTIYFRYSGPPDTAWGAKLMVSEDYGWVKLQWEQDLQSGAPAPPSP